MKKIIILLAGGVMLFPSCRKFLEQPPYNNVSVEEIFQDFEGARTTLIGLYDKLRGTNYYLRDFYVYPDIAGGNIKYSRNAEVLFNSYSFTRDELVGNDLRNFYNLAYSVLYGANNILQQVNRVTDASASQRSRIRAEAFAFRALVHFDLVRTFAQPYGFTPDASHPGIVLRTANPSVLQPTPEKASVRQVYDQVVADIDTAINLYAKSGTIYPTGDARTFLSTDALNALKTRVALYRNDLETVISHASELIAANRYPLVSNGSYVSSWSGRNISSESIFELLIPVSGSSGGLGAFYNPSVNVNGPFAATNDLLNLYAPGDIRGASSLYVRQQQTGGTFYYTKKYQGIADSINNIRILRSSELYLNRAEAYAKTGRLPDALADLNVIRKRALPAATDFVSDDQQVVLDEILLERRRELAFEGHLFFDLARNKKDLVRIDNTAAIKSFTYPNPLYAYPIPVQQ
ncbi:MAG TPA: RagB/SusD family nutrient uptake outer membrane protein [Flavisolibacter sp.]